MLGGLLLLPFLNFFCFHYFNQVYGLTVLLLAFLLLFLLGATPARIPAAVFVRRLLRWVRWQVLVPLAFRVVASVGWL